MLDSPIVLLWTPDGPSLQKFHRNTIPQLKTAPSTNHFTNSPETHHIGTHDAHPNFCCIRPSTISISSLFAIEFVVNESKSFTGSASRKSQNHTSHLTRTRLCKWFFSSQLYTKNGRVSKDYSILNCLLMKMQSHIQLHSVYLIHQIVPSFILLAIFCEAICTKSAALFAQFIPLSFQCTFCPSNAHSLAF